ncbi:MAG TPA: S8 family serine peptidase [Chitinophagaceae bacterium]
MQAILKAPLYKRPQPTNEVEAMGYLPAGSVITVDSIVQGKTLDGNSSWIKASDGFHYWADDSVLTKVPIAFDPTKMSWGHQLLDIPGIWARQGTTGRNCVVAVIDTGIVTANKDLSPNIHPLSKSFLPGDSSLEDSDPDNHGTKMAGIIAATGKNIVYGVAPEAQLLVIRATKTTTEFNLSLFTAAMNYVAGLKEVDIVSISYAFPENDQGFQQAVQACLDANKIVVAAIGNIRSPMPGVNIDPDRFPAAYNNGYPSSKGVMGIGAFDSGKQLCTFSASNAHLSCLAPGDFSILTTGPGDAPVNGSMTSIATAFTAGCLALMISYAKLKGSGSSPDFIPALLNTCDPMGAGSFSPQSGYGRINLKNAFLKI